MKEIESIPLLTTVEEKALATKAFSGDKIAQNKLVKANLRFVVKIAKSYKGYELEDLINEGNMGLMKAAEKFNPDCGTKFITYAVWWIKAYIQKSIRETATGIKFPSSKYKEMNNPKWKISSLNKEMKFDNKNVELISLIEDENIESPDNKILKKFLVEELYQNINELNDIEKNVILNRFGFKGDRKSLSEIGRSLNLSRERIRQIEHRALCLLKEKLVS
jgi:RNA polymerase primary sigma factor